MPLPIRAAIEPRDWPHLCAPSPESLMISTMCYFSVIGVFLPAVAWVFWGVFVTDFNVDESCMVLSWLLLCRGTG
jgi:hypothetical protein